MRVTLDGVKTVALVALVAGCGGAGFSQAVENDAAPETSAVVEASAESGPADSGTPEASAAIDTGVDVGAEAATDVVAVVDAAPIVCDRSKYAPLDSGLWCSGTLPGFGSNPCGTFNLDNGMVAMGSADPSCTWSCSCSAGLVCCSPKVGAPAGDCLPHC